MQHNADPSFAGIDGVKDAQRQQLQKFEEAAARGDWMAIHDDHYDWWMFPVDEPSSFGFKWTVYDGDAAELKKDAEYIARYLRGVELLARAWGWDLGAAGYVANPQPGQAWQEWPIRLYKAARSVRLFGFAREFESLKKFADDLMFKGEKMYYHRDLSWLFKQ